MAGPARRDLDMTDGVIWRQLVSFALPLMLGLLFQQLYNTVDSIIVGRFVSKQALAAVGSTGSIINTLVGVCGGLSTGATVVISQAYGTHDLDRLGKAVHTTIVLTFVMSLLATGVGVLIVPGMLRLMDTPADVLADANTYLTIYFFGITGLLIYNMGSGILRAVGDSRHPLYFLIFSALLNIALDLLFVLGFKRGVDGVAYATIISQLISSLLVLWTLTKTDAPYAIHWKRLAIDGGTLGRIVSIGMPAAAQQGITAFSNVFVQSYINAFLSDAMAGWSSYNKLDIFVVLPVQAIALASTTFVGQNFGAGRLDRARKGVNQAMGMSFITCAAASALVIVFARPLLSLFNDDPEVLRYGVYFVSVISPFYVTMSVNQICAGAMRGIGRSQTPMLAMLGSFVVFRQIYLYVTKLMGLGLPAVTMAYPAGWILCSIIMFIAYRRSPLCRKPKTD